MRIALVHKRLDRSSGTEIDFYRTAEGLQRLGHEIHLFCSEYRIEPPEGVIAHRVPVLCFGRTLRLWSFALVAPSIVRKHRCDVVVSFGRMIRQDVLRSGGGSHKVFLEKLAAECGWWRRAWHALSIYHQSLLLLERLQLRAGNFSMAVVVSERVRAELSRTYGVPENKIEVLRNGVDQELFHPRLRDRWRQTVRRQWNIPEHVPLVLFVGSGFRRKGLDRLIRLWSSPRLQDAHLMVVGNDRHLRSYRAWAEGQAPGKIIFAGHQEHVERFYGAADLLILPSVQEAFGNVVLEALAAGLPVVVSRAAGAAELLEGSLADGIVDHPDVPLELESKLLNMLRRSRDPQIGIEAREIAEAYSWDRHFEKLDRRLRQVAGG